ncbi:MAG: DUF4369 domain-containing protein, partial [Desulfobulbia bacterium]
MKNIAKSIILALLIIACSKEKTGNMTVVGHIDGLKKGTMYLQKVIDTVIVSIDSVALNGSPDFILSDDLTSPELYYIQLDNNTDKIIAFFGEKGIINIQSKLDKFTYSAEISGSENQILLEEHTDMLKKFNGRQLEIIKGKFDAQKANDTILLADLEKEESGLKRRQFYYTVNFAVNHGASEIAPFLALTELRYANVQLLD